MTNKASRTVFSSDVLHESYERYTHSCGLDVYIFPKDMSATYAIFGAKYGSLHNRFRPKGQEREIVVPDGIAHFLEHKLFANEDGSDSFERFSEYGADANAYTSFNKTAYLFSCTDHLEESLGELLDFVTHPYFTKESVESEMGIISEEIRMYDDSPADRCFYGMLEAMTKRAPATKAKTRVWSLIPHTSRARLISPATSLPLKECATTPPKFSASFFVAFISSLGNIGTNKRVLP